MWAEGNSHSGYSCAKLSCHWWCICWVSGNSQLSKQAWSGLTCLILACHWPCPGVYWEVFNHWLSTKIRALVCSVDSHGVNISPVADFWLSVCCPRMQSWGERHTVGSPQLLPLWPWGLGPWGPHKEHPTFVKPAVSRGALGGSPLKTEEERDQKEKWGQVTES